MSIVLYDLVGADDVRFSPNCWRTRLALAHKGLPCDARPTLFTAIPAIADRQQKTVPAIEDSDRVVGDSWKIAEYLEAAYPERPSLFGGQAGKALSWFVQNWAIANLHARIMPFIVLDIHDQLEPADKPYFRLSREKRLGSTLEEAQAAGRAAGVGAFRQGLEPLRQMLATQQFLGGAGPLYADYLVFGALQWARTASNFALLADDDPVASWFGRCLDLYDGLGRTAPARR